jgi:protein-tyrosine phosphatase
MRGALEHAVDVIDAALAGGGAVLVHCKLGKSRSATLVIAYAMQRHNFNLKDAYDAAFTGRHGLLLNLGFETMLRHLQEEREGPTAVRKTRSNSRKL